MIKETVLKVLNEQVGKEIYSAYLYLSMASYFDSVDLLGFAHWMKIQAKEELTHAMKIYDFIYERGGRVELPHIDKPKSSWDSPLNVFEEVLNHERNVTSSINNILELAIQEKDYATMNFLQWFIEEQVEEEAQAEQVLKKLQKLSESPISIYMLDKELGNRQE